MLCGVGGVPGADSMGQFDTGFSGRVRGGRRKRTVLVIATIVVSLLGMAVVIGATQGFDSLWRFLTVPTLEAKSGKKYTPQGAMKRLIEKLDEEDGE